MNVGISDRLREQIAASLSTARIDAQLAPLRATIAKSVLPKLDFALPTISHTAFAKVYGREWAPIATKLANIQNLFDGIDFDRMFAGWFPPNWDRDRGVEQYYDFIKLAENETLPLTGVPNPELTYLLADAETAEERADLLVKHSTVIVADCRAVLDDFDNDTHLVRGLREALDAYEARFHHPAQSYAASILDTALREAFTPKRWSYPNVKKLLHTGRAPSRCAPPACCRPQSHSAGSSRTSGPTAATPSRHDRTGTRPRTRCTPTSTTRSTPSSS